MIHHHDTKGTKPRRLRHRPLGVLGVVVVNAALVVLALQPAGAAPACVGDCDSNGMVSVSELITGVRISLGAALDDCAAFDLDGDGQVHINELITAVTAALAGCPATPSPTATPTASSTASSTVADSPTPTATPTDTAEPGTPTATPTLPMVSGHWREEPLTVTDSTCPELVTNEFAADLASRPPCEQIVETISDTAVSFEDCTATRVDGTLDRDGTIHVTYPTTDNTNQGCTVSLTASFVVPAGMSPTTAAYTFAVSFSGTCVLDACTIDATGAWAHL